MVISRLKVQRLLSKPLTDCRLLDDLDTMSLDDVYNHLKVYEPEVQNKSESNSQNMAFISSSNASSRKCEVHTASVPTASTQVSTASTNVAAASLSHDTNMALLSMRAYRFWKKTGKKITIQGSDVDGFDKLKVECFNCHNMGHFAREWDWSYMANEEENHAPVADDEAPIEFALMAKSSSSLENEVEARLVVFKEQEIKFCEKFRGLERDVKAIPIITLMIKDIGTVVVLGGMITGKGIIKTGKVEFENVYFMKELKYNLFSVSQICDNKNSVLFTDSECIVLGKYFKLKDDTNMLLRTPRQHNMYSIDLNNIIHHKNLTCLVAKASVDESMLWHRWLCHQNFKTMNKFVRNNLVKGLSSKVFENDHTCVACLKGKQHKASCKTKLVNSVSKPLHTLHMDLFEPNSISSLNHKWYCLVVTDDFSRGEFKNKEMNELCTKKGIKREFSNAKTPQQNRLKQLTLLVMSKIRCHVMILNTLDHLEKFYAKEDEGTSSINISGTKDVASLNVKKDVSSLRYIALPNWFHEAHIDTRNCDAPHGCNADVPENSGISNPTTSLKVPSTDQVEHVVSIIVEYEIPTVSLLVPTVYLDNSPESSCGPRLISKRDFSQNETLSLGNALSLLDRFEDTIEVEMDVKSAFLYGTIDEEVYMMQSSGFHNPKFPDRVYKMDKAMYGLHQEPRAWYGTLSKPDIMFAVCACARHQVTPKECHLHDVKRIFRYLKVHPRLGLWYPKESPFNLVSYSGSDYGGATQDRKSNTRGCQFLRRRLISWQCKKQTIMDTFTTEAEYVAAASGYGQVLWIQNQMLDYSVFLGFGLTIAGWASHEKFYLRKSHLMYYCCKSICLGLRNRNL
nr:putative ribonuclease H-like domain-containing protein [Tanacetum cinerariifolium]GEV33909.1 putative ribonuclease H-like domain-containing protein [Tanacetum cinerariifolium]